MSEATLGTALPEQIARVRDVRQHYLDVGPPGALAAYLMELDLNAADRAIADQDIVAMLAVYQKLQLWKD